MNTQAIVGEQIDGQLLYERQKELRVSEIYLPAPSVVAAGLQVPENIGSVLRIADAVGSQGAIFVSDGNNDAYPLKRIQRTARSTETTVTWELWEQEQFLDAKHAFAPLIALELTTASVSIFESDLPEQCAFMIGNERYGIPKALLSQCQQAVHIPMYGINGSMNVTHALAIALYEWRRQYSSQWAG
jgi:tRNA G18 (ribose-2'-O)-methylase SpoU